MAKAPVKTETVSGTPAIRFGGAPAPITRKIGNTASPFAALMLSMPAPQGDKVANFFVPAADVSAAITDKVEREKALKDNARKLSNSLSGLSRRLSKKRADFAFVLRTIEEDGKLGVCVYRVAPEAPKAEATAA